MDEALDEQLCLLVRTFEHALVDGVFLRVVLQLRERLVEVRGGERIAETGLRPGPAMTGLADESRYADNLIF